jgi:HK97 family phage major capsid protein
MQLNNYQEEAIALNKKAIVILQDPKADAQDFEKAKSMMEEAKSLQEKHALLSEARSSVVSLQREIPAAEQIKEAGFSTFGTFLAAVAAADKGFVDERLQYFASEDGPSATKELAGNVGADGGYLIPPEFMTTVMSVVAEESLVRSRATIIPMARRSIAIPALDQTDASVGQPYGWFGGITFEWIEENTEQAESSPQFRQVTLNAHDLVALTRASETMVADSAISLEAFFNSRVGFAGGIAFVEDMSFLNGTGVGQPLGVLNSPATLSETRATNGSIEYDDIVQMYSKFLPSGQGVWVASQSTMPTLLSMNGPSGNASYLWGSLSAGVPNTLLGLPIIWTEKTPALNSAGDLLLADFGYYLIGDRDSGTIESTRFDKWSKNQISWKIINRVDGRPWMSAPLTYNDGSTQVSPFVKLAAGS